MRRAYLAIGVLATSCATGPEVFRRSVADADAEAPRCEAFAAFDARARALLEQAAAAAPPQDLMPTVTRLTAARRACARQTLSSLLTTREQHGSEAAQAELDALALAFGDEAFEALALDGFGADALTLRPQLTLAKAKAASARRTGQDAADHAAADRWASTEPERSAPVHHDSAPSTSPLDRLGVSGRVRPERVEGARPLERSLADAAVATCLARDPEEGLRCLEELRERGADAPSLTRTARELISRALESPRSPSGSELARLYDLLLPLATPEATGALLTALEASRQREWPRVEAALITRRHAQAAELAAPFSRLPHARAAVDLVRDLAVAGQLELARQAGARPHAAALHRLIAARFGGPPSAWPALPAGRWDLSRWQCARPLTGLPALPADLELRLVARCQRPLPPEQLRPEDDQRVFELERSLPMERVDGEVVVRCGAHVSTWRVSLREVVVEEEPAAVALLARLQVIATEARATCRAKGEARFDRECSALDEGDVLDAEERLARQARVAGAWPSCGAAWFERRTGVRPPDLR